VVALARSRKFANVINDISQRHDMDSAIIRTLEFGAVHIVALS
jgi:hypothetical protein